MKVSLDDFNPIIGPNRLLRRGKKIQSYTQALERLFYVNYCTAILLYQRPHEIPSHLVKFNA